MRPLCASQISAQPLAAGEAAPRRVYGAAKGPSGATIAIIVILTFVACWIFAQFKGYDMLDKMLGGIFKHKPKMEEGLPESGPDMGGGAAVGGAT